MNNKRVIKQVAKSYLDCFLNSWIEEAIGMGFSRREAKILVYKTFTGSFNLLVKTGEDAIALRKRVTSKGGTTEAAVKVLSKSNMGKTFKTAVERKLCQNHNSKRN